MERVLQQMILQLLQKMTSLPNRKGQLTVVGVFPLPPSFLERRCIEWMKCGKTYPDMRGAI